MFRRIANPAGPVPQDIRHTETTTVAPTGQLFVAGSQQFQTFPIPLKFYRLHLSRFQKSLKKAPTLARFFNHPVC
jgi:hypothetical protein